MNLKQYVGIHSVLVSSPCLGHESHGYESEGKEVQPEYARWADAARRKGPQDPEEWELRSASGVRRCRLLDRGIGVPIGRNSRVGGKCGDW